MDKQITEHELGFIGHFVDPKNPKNKYEEHFVHAGQESTIEQFWGEHAKLVDWY